MSVEALLSRAAPRGGAGGRFHLLREGGREHSGRILLHERSLGPMAGSSASGAAHSRRMSGAETTI